MGHPINRPDTNIKIPYPRPVRTITFHHANPASNHHYNVLPCKIHAHSNATHDPILFHLAIGKGIE